MLFCFVSFDCDAKSIATQLSENVNIDANYFR